MTQACVVVGYGPGVGAAVARAFAAEGMAIAAIARDADRLAAGCAELRANGHEAEGFAADATDPASLGAAIAAAGARFGAPDVLIYNAARWRPGPVLDMTPENLVADLRVGTLGALLAARAVAPAMRERGRGSLLFTGGGFGLYPSPIAPSLSIDKGAIRALALMLAEELAASGVRVGTVTIMGTVAPGTRFDPDAIAGAFVALHRGAPNPATAETRFG